MRELIRAGTRLAERRFTEAFDGNLSARADHGTILVTASGVSKGELKPGDFVSVSPSGKLLRGRRLPSSELPMHLALYKANANIRAVVHAHPPFATAFAVAGVALTPNILPEAILGLGDVPMVRYAMPSSTELGDRVSRFADSTHGAILAHHGAVTWGDSVREAEFYMEKLEHWAVVEWHARAIGGPQPLDPKDVSQLKDHHPLSGSRLR